MFLIKKMEEKYRGRLFARQEIKDDVFYFSSDDFEGLNKKEYNFKNRWNDTVRGYFYFYNGAEKDRIIVFDHGLAIGHRSYFREIETLARKGYTVYTFDHTGCTESEGEGIHGFLGSLSDLDDCLKALKTDFKDKSFAVVGHSRGGFSTLNIPKYHNDLTHIVAISGFSEIKDMIYQLVPFFAKRGSEHIYNLEKTELPEYAEASAIETLENSKVKALVIHSADDATVSVRHYHKMYSALKNMPNVEFLLVDGKNHNPHYTADAVKYKSKFFKTYNKMKKKKLLETKEQKEAFKSSYDWLRMTAQDDALWAEIFKFLNS